MTNEYKILIDFVEGRLTGLELRKELENNRELKLLLTTKELLWHDTYIETNPYNYLMSLRFSNVGDLLNAQGAIHLFLDKKDIKYNEFKKYSEEYDLLLDTQPNYIDIDPVFIEKYIIPKNRPQKKGELKKIMKEKFKSMFQYHKRPPSWIQSAEWPIVNDKPLYFLGQYEIKDCNVFHDNGYVYIFVDKESKNIKTVTQLY